MTRLLLTGGDGFVRGHLQRHLREAAPETELLAPVFDITDRAAAKGLIEAAQPDALLHLTAISAPAEAAGAPDHAWAVNVQGALNLAEAVLAHAPSCRFVFVSSAEVYGEAFTAGELVTEDTPPEPLTPYAKTKAAEEDALAALPGLKLLRLRPANHTGARAGPRLSGARLHARRDPQYRRWSHAAHRRFAGYPARPLQGAHPGGDRSGQAAPI